MLDPDLQKQIDTINANLVAIKKGPGAGRSFVNGMFSGFGYMVGLVLVVVIVGWILNVSGILPSFKQQLKDFQLIVNQARVFFDADKPNDQQGSGGE